MLLWWHPKFQAHSEIYGAMISGAKSAAEWLSNAMMQLMRSQSSPEDTCIHHVMFLLSVICICLLIVCTISVAHWIVEYSTQPCILTRTKWVFAARTVRRRRIVAPKRRRFRCTVRAYGLIIQTLHIATRGRLQIRCQGIPRPVFATYQWFITTKTRNRRKHTENGNISFQNALDKALKALQEFHQGHIDLAKFRNWFKHSWDHDAKAFRDRCVTKKGRDLVNSLKALGGNEAGFSIQQGRGKATGTSGPRTPFHELRLIPEEWDIGGDDSVHPTIIQVNDVCQGACGLALVRQEHFARVLKVTSDKTLAVIVPGSIEDMLVACPAADEKYAQLVKFSIRDPATSRVEPRGDKMPMVLYHLSPPSAPMVSRAMINAEMRLPAQTHVDMQVFIFQCLTEPEVWTRLSKPWHGKAMIGDRLLKIHGPDSILAVLPAVEMRKGPPALRFPVKVKASVAAACEINSGRGGIFCNPVRAADPDAAERTAAVRISLPSVGDSTPSANIAAVEEVHKLAHAIAGFRGLMLVASGLKAKFTAEGIAAARTKWAQADYYIDANLAVIHTSVWRVRGLPFGTQPATLAQALHSWKWTVIPLRAENASTGMSWIVGATQKPPKDLIQLDSGVVSITEEQSQPSAGARVPHQTWPKAESASQTSTQAADPWLDPLKDPWNQRGRVLSKPAPASSLSLPTSPSVTTASSSTGGAVSETQLEQLVERITEARMQDVRHQVSQLGNRLDEVSQKVQQVETFSHEVADAVKGHRNENREQFQALQTMMTQLLEARGKTPRHE